MAPLEIRHRSVRPISAKHAQASRFLQQSPWNEAVQCGNDPIAGVDPKRKLSFSERRR